MKQLTGLDAAFLYMETPTTYGHISGLMTFERPGPNGAEWAQPPQPAAPRRGPSRSRRPTRNQAGDARI
jgi:hypothetical protein